MQKRLYPRLRSMRAYFIQKPEVPRKKLFKKETWKPGIRKKTPNDQFMVSGFPS
jgi:hypothetical protein